MGIRPCVFRAWHSWEWGHGRPRGTVVAVVRAVKDVREVRAWVRAGAGGMQDKAS